VQTDGTCNTFSLPYNFQLSENVQDLEINNVKIANPVVNWPVLSQTGGTTGILSLHNWDLTTQSTTFSNIIALTGGTLGQLNASGLNWYDAIGTGNVFSGSAVPQTLTVSNYAGPQPVCWRLASSQPTKNGDAFTNTYTGHDNLRKHDIQRSDRQARSTGWHNASGLCLNGCTGTWTAAAN